MKSKLTYIMIVLAVVFIYSCNSNTTQPKMAKYEWDCSLLNETDSLDIQSFFSKSEMLKLEETEKSKIGNIDKIVISDSLLFILDKDLARKMMCFSVNTGKFLCEIGEIGSGHNEYISISDFNIDEENKLIYALCNRKNVYTYTFDGKLTEKREIPFYAENMEYLNRCFYFMTTDYNVGELVVTNEKLHVLMNYFTNNDRIDHVEVHPFQKTPDGYLSYHRYLDNNVYKINEDNSLDILYQIDFGNNNIVYDDVKCLDRNETKERLANSRGNIKYITENADYAWIVCFDKNMPCLSVFNKTTLESQFYPYMHVIDSKLGRCMEYPIEYSTSEGFIEVVQADNINDDLVKNKTIESGHNPVLYWHIK